MSKEYGCEKLVLMENIIFDETTGIIYRRWQAQEPKAVFLLVHGLGAHTARWEFLGDFFQRHNVSAYGLELKGFGQTQGERGHIDSFDTYFQDIRFLYDVIKRENPDKKIFLLGESMGALICFLYAALMPQLFDGLICVTPAFSSKLYFSLRTYLAIWFALFFNPKKQFPVPISPQMCTRDKEYQKIIDNDPLDKRTATARLYWNILKAQRGVTRFFKGKIDISLLVLTAGEDAVVDSLATYKIFQGLNVYDKEILNYTDMSHALSIDVGREKVFEDILKWVEKKIAR